MSWSLAPCGPSEVKEGELVTFQVTRTHSGNETVNVCTLQNQGWNNLSDYQGLQGAPLVFEHDDLGPRYFSIQTFPDVVYNEGTERFGVGLYDSSGSLIATSTFAILDATPLPSFKPSPTHSAPNISGALIAGPTAVIRRQLRVGLSERHKQPLSERLHTLMLRGFGMHTADFSHAAVERAMAGLNSARAQWPPMTGEVLWMSAPTAFTLPGRYVYLSRRFVERCASDAPVAFALAHEIAHHDLGHLDRAERWMTRAARIAPLRAVELIAAQLAQWIHSRTREFEADAYGLELCRRAGYDMKQSLEAFDILRSYSLDRRDIDGVYGPLEEYELDPRRAANPFDWLFIESRLWVVRHRRSHPAIVERLAMLRAQMESTLAKAASADAIDADNDRARPV